MTRFATLTSSLLLASVSTLAAASDFYGPRNTIPRQPIGEARSCETVRLLPSGPRPRYEIVREARCAVPTSPMPRVVHAGPRSTIPLN
jgi:hypothetical protein